MNMEKSIEIEIITYNRSKILDRWLQENLNVVNKLNMGIAIYDSSSNNETEELIKEYNLRHHNRIKYVHLPSSIRVDEKVITAILESDYRYVWPIGDSRSIDFSAFESRVIPFVNHGYDFVCIWPKVGLKNSVREFSDSVDFFCDCFWHTTWLGGLIFCKDIFSPLQSRNILKEYLVKYCKNDGFSYLGIFYDLIAQRRIKALLSYVSHQDLEPKKVPGWLSRYLEVWCGNLCYLIDSVDDAYNTVKEKVLKETWQVLALDGAHWCYHARKNNGLTLKDYNYYDSNGLLDRVSRHKKRIKHFAEYSGMQIPLERNAVSNYDGMTVPTQRHAFPV